MARGIKHTDDYLSRVLKHIPSEIVMAYVAIEGVLRTTYEGDSARLETILWIVSGALVFLTPLWLWRVMRVKSLQQLFLSTLSLPVWLFAMGGPFAFLKWYEPALGAIALPFYTLLVPIITGKPPR